jgi:phytoene dehydrogenase-like protein
MNGVTVMLKRERPVVVVGGGLAGLTAACYLARAGVNVTVLEKGNDFGGRAATRIVDDFAFNRGIHALYTGGAASEVLADLGIAPHGQSPKHVSVLRAGQFYPAPVDAQALLRSRLFDAADKLALVQVFAALPRVRAETVASMSVQAWIDDHARRPRVRQFLLANARTLVYSSALDRVSAEVFIAKTQLALKHPVLYLDGGWQTLVEALKGVAERHGARLVSGARVEMIQHVAGDVHSLRLTDGHCLEAAAVVIATTAQEAARLVDRAPFRKRVDALLPARVACLDVALRRLPNPRHTILQDLDRPCFMSTQSLYSRVAPDGGALMYTMKQLAPEAPSDPRRDEHDLEDLLDQAQPGWSDVLVTRQFLPRIDAIGMLPTTPDGYGGRPGPGAAGIDGLYLAGDWIGEGFLSDAAFASGRRAARLIVARQPTARSLEGAPAGG